MFPTKETVSMFIEMCNRDGILTTVTDFLDEEIDIKYKPALSFLKSNIKMIQTKDSELCPESFSIGFLVCFHIFRLQIEAEKMEIEDLQLNLDNLNSYVEFLEGKLSKENESA